MKAQSMQRLLDGWPALRPMAVAAGWMALLTGCTALATAVMIQFFWYGDLYADVMGAFRLLGLIAACDLVLGPVLMMVVFNPGKSRLARAVDLTVLGAVQIGALLYGATVLWGARPVFAVFASDRINVVAASQVAVEDLPISWEGFRATHLPATGPLMVALRMPTDTQGRNRALELEISGRLLHTLPRYYGPIDDHALRRAARPLRQLAAERPQLRAALWSAARRTRLEPSALLYLPAETSRGFFTALLDPTDLAIVAFADVDPF